MILTAILAAAVGGTAAALASENSALPGAPSPTPNDSPGPAQTPHFATNASGQTYGSSANTIPSDASDLISATGKNSAGQIVGGYVRNDDLNAATGANVKTPAQALAYEAKAEKAGPVNIPLYAVDGTTVIGSFTITPPMSGASAVSSGHARRSSGAR